MLKIIGIAILVMVFISSNILCIEEGSTMPTNTNAYSKWKYGLSKDENYFPIAVWLQNPDSASKYKG